jgi:hypothetical protein
LRDVGSQPAVLLNQFGICFACWAHRCEKSWTERQVGTRTML